MKGDIRARDGGGQVCASACICEHRALRRSRAPVTYWALISMARIEALRFWSPKTSREAGFRRERQRDFLRRGIEPRRRNLRRCRWLKGRRVKIRVATTGSLGQGRRHTEGRYRSNIGHRCAIPCRKSTWLSRGDFTNRLFRKHTSRPSRLLAEHPHALAARVLPWDGPNGHVKGCHTVMRRR